MRYQNDWTRPKKVEDVNQEADYYNKYEPVVDEFTGQHFFGKVIYAYTTTNSFKNKSDKVTQSEVLHLIILINNTQSYIQVDIWGARRTFDEDTKLWGDWSNNPVRLQDFLYLAKRQKGDVNIEDSFEYSTAYEDRTVYPHLCGVQLSILAAKVGEREYKGKFYATNVFELFNADGHSAQELQLGIKELDDIHNKMKELKAKYAEFMGIEPQENVTTAPTQQMQKPQQQPQALQQIQSLQGVVNTQSASPFASVIEQATEIEPFNPDDDLPF